MTATATKRDRKLSRYIDDFKGTHAERADGSRRFIPNEHYGRGRRGTPLGRIEEAMREQQTDDVAVLWGDCDDSLLDADLTIPACKKLRTLLDAVRDEVGKLNADPTRQATGVWMNYVTREVRVPRADLRAVIESLTDSLV
jgi:hypothetical protein